MNLELTAEQLALRDTVRRFCAQRADVATYVRKVIDSPSDGNDEVWQGLAALGAAAVLVPQQYNGAGLTMLEAGIVAEELGAALYPGPWLSSAVVATRALTRMGADHNAATLLTGIADGSTIAAVGPFEGFELSAIESSEGSVLRGTIASVPDFAAADVVLLLAEADDDIRYFAVERSGRGVHSKPQDGVDPTRRLFTVTLDDAPAQRLAFASPDDLRALTDDLLVAYAADALGAARAVMALAVQYATVREQFGQPIGSFQAVQHLCVDMYETVELARCGVIHGLWAADAAEPAERHLAAIRAKAFASRLATVGDIAIQVLGGIGYTWEHDAHLYLRRLLSWSAMAGGSDQYYAEVGACLAQSVPGRGDHGQRNSAD